MIRWKERIRAATVHLAISVLIAALAAWLVFGLWYPYPYREISGGRDLFLLVVSVDVVMGPLLTLAIFNRAKPRRELTLDLAVVGVLQLSALVYGLWTVALARPVHLVYEIDRFRVVHAVDVPQELLDRTPAGVSALPWFGPTIVAVRPFLSESERVDATIAALGGVPLAARPDLWRQYDQARTQVIQAAKPVGELARRFPRSAAQIDSVLRAAGRDRATTAWLPLVARTNAWTVFIDARTAQVVAYMPLDTF
ncbi:MAG: fimb protein [Ramlibacter sp.]